MSILFLQQLSEADCLQVDGDFIRFFTLEDSEDGICGDDPILDLTFLNGEGDEVAVRVTLDEALTARFDETSGDWQCAGYTISLHKVTPLSPSPNGPVIEPPAQTGGTILLDRYQLHNAATKINSYYLPSTYEVATGKHSEAFLRAKKEAIRNIKHDLAALENVTHDQFFTERRKGLN